ncbi:MAG TPA: LysE family transporter [Opitutaceae bacterium]
MINYTAQFITVCGLHLLAVASPGPDFAIVVKQSIQHGRRTGLWTALGIGSGICVHIAYTLLGFGLVLKSSWIAFTTMKVVAAGYLAYLGMRALLPRKLDASANGARIQFEPARESAVTALNQASLRAYATGFWTNALNPKVTIFFVAVFSVVVNPATPRLILIGYGVWMAVMTALWFSLVAAFFTRVSVRNAFLRLGPWFDRVIGAVLLGLCVALAFSSFHGK